MINHRHRITGDAVTWIIEEVIAMKNKIRIDGLQEALDAFIDSQVLIPGKWQPVPPNNSNQTLSNRSCCKRSTKTSKPTKNRFNGNDQLG